MYNKCISLWLIVLIIIMTFCVSHQKQLNILDDDDDANKIRMSTAFKGGDDVNVAEIIATAQQNLSTIGTSSTNLGESYVRSKRKREEREGEERNKYSYGSVIGSAAPSLFFFFPLRVYVCVCV
jgi:ribosomal protein L12E/L44/L45/RPP1/RPP2